MEENLENEEFQEQNSIGYKIIAGREYTVQRQDYNGKTYYKIPVKKNHQDGTEEFGLKQVRFKKDVELQDKTKIKILNGFEDFYQKDKYNTIFTLVITEFEITEQPAEVVNQAYDDFNSNDSDWDLPF